MSIGIKKNDTVLVLTGEEKGKRGRVLSVNPKKARLLVEKLNMIKKHMKPSRKFSQGGIIDKEAPIQRSNVLLICPKCDKPTRIGHKILKSGVKVRLCKKCTEVMD